MTRGAIGKRAPGLGVNFLGLAVVSRMLNVSVSTLKRWIKQKRMRAGKTPGGTWVVHRLEVERLKRVMAGWDVT